MSTFTSVFKDKKILKREKTVVPRFFAPFSVVDGRIRIGTKNHGRPKNLRILRFLIRNTALNVEGISEVQVRRMAPSASMEACTLVKKPTSRNNLLTFLRNSGTYLPYLPSNRQLSQGIIAFFNFCIEFPRLIR
jgi:hypothetical protein